VIATVVGAIGNSCGGTTAPTPVWDGLVRVTGTVRNFRTGEPVVGARVTIGDYTGSPVTPANITATTDRSGVYTLTVPSAEQFISSGTRRV
jgi:hypothetical protein